MDTQGTSESIRLFRQQFDIIVGGKPDNLEPVGQTPRNIERLRADGTRRP